MKHLQELQLTVKWLGTAALHLSEFFCKHVVHTCTSVLHYATPDLPGPLPYGVSASPSVPVSYIRKKLMFRKKQLPNWQPATSAKWCICHSEGESSGLVEIDNRRPHREVR